MSTRVLVTCPQMQHTIDVFRERLEAAGVEVELPQVVQQLSEDELVAIIGEFEGMIAGDDPLTARVIASAPKLKVISKWGVGTDGIDKEAAAAAGIRVTNTPGTFGDEVADVVLGYTIMLARRLHAIDRGVREGGWPKPIGTSLAGKTMGVVGLGSIGRAVAGRAIASGMKVLGHDVAAAQENAAAELGVKVVDLDTLLQGSNFVSLNCPLTAENRHLIDDRALEMMPEGSYLVNTARGPLVDEAALVRALEDGRLAGAALDVFETEPLASDNPLRRFENVILGSHNASNTSEATMRVSEMAVANLIQALEMEGR